MNILPFASSLPVLTTLMYKGQVVKIIDATTVMDYLFNETELAWPDASARFSQWCRNHNVHYYARPGDVFSTNQALEEAHANSRPYLILEDLS